MHIGHSIGTGPSEFDTESQADSAVSIPATPGDLGRDEWLGAVAKHLERHSRKRFERLFLGLLARLAAHLPVAVVMHDLFPITGRCAFPCDCGCSARTR